ncbi:MAG TPA: trypsin-like peptidase domain-containing protein, partial [Pirellulaceae bacterium]|nr:trypsin-like peptidase domain-containing protein [Pirellulaceae bacterium]
MTFGTATKLGIPALLAGLAICLWPTIGAAQEQPALSGTDAVAAIQKAVIEVVAKTQASVVAVARIRKDALFNADIERFDERPGIFPGPRALAASDPSSPDFVPQEYGTGVVIDRAGLILTTYHVLADLNKNDYYVWTNKRPFAAMVIAADPWLDLAVLKIDAKDLTPIKFGDAKGIQKGQFVIALGNPLAIARDGEVSSAWGLIANVNRVPPVVNQRPKSPVWRETLHHYGNLLQTDARLERGTSGGALVNLQGEMIGLTTALTPQVDVETSAGFAIPVDQAFKDAIEKLKIGRKVEYGFLGVAPEHLSVEERQRGRHGAKVFQVVARTPAADLGLFEESRGDDTFDIITHVNGQEVSDATNLIMHLSKLPAFSEVALTISRTPRDDPARARVLQKKVKLAKKHMDTLRPVFASVADPVWRGLLVEHPTATPNFRDRLPFMDTAGCVAVLDVERGSPAWKAGLRTGMFIAQVGESRVATPDAFHEAVAKSGGAVKLRLTEEVGNSQVVV